LLGSLLAKSEVFITIENTGPYPFGNCLRHHDIGELSLFSISHLNSVIARMSQLPGGEQNVQQEEDEGQICQYCLTIFSNDDAESLLRSRSGLEYRRKLSSIFRTAEDCVLCRLLLPTWDTTPHRMAKWLKRYDAGRYGPNIRFKFQGDLKNSNRITASRHLFLWYWKILEDFEASTTFGMLNQCGWPRMT
jgi:hypothetical protein